MDDPTKDLIPRSAVEYICRKNTVSTNPYEHKYHDKFIQFMNDPEISDFGRWQHSNGFNTALAAVKCDLDKVPSVTPKQRWIPVTERLPEKGNEVLVCYDFKGRSSVMTGDLWGDGKFHGFDEEYLTPEGRKYRKAVAWMPLPEPYREEGEQDG